MIGREYSGEWDAETLMEADRIKNDPNRLKAAETAAQQMVKRKEEELQSLKKVESGGTTQQTDSLSEDKKGPGVGNGSKDIYIGKTSEFGNFKRII